MSWIKEIPYEKATGQLLKLYNRVRGPHNNIDNVLTVHSLRPHTLEGHLKLYKNVLHHNRNTLPKWYLEVIGIYVSILNHCDYCVAHHSAGLSRLLSDSKQTNEILGCLQNKSPEKYFTDKYLKGLRYVEKLTVDPANIEVSAVEELRNAGLSDGEILEINQVCSYFNYVNRSVLGLGVSTDGDILGLSPGNDQDPDNWSHQ